MPFKYDLLLKGGEVIDPSQSLQEVRDVAFAQGKVAAIAADIPESEAAKVYDAKGKIVTPGLIDIHTHFYYGVDPLSIDPRRDLLPQGITCAVDAGSAGATIYKGLSDLIIKPSQLHLYALLNIEVLGMPGVLAGIRGRVRDLDLADPKGTARMIQSNPDNLVGIKAILHGGSGGPKAEDCLPLLKHAVEAAEKAQCLIMAHIDGGFCPGVLAENLRPGDIITHCFQGKEPTVIGEDGKVLPEIKEAVTKGINLDFAPGGRFNFSWKVAETAAKDGLWPDLISTDYVFLGAAFGKDVALYPIADCMSLMMNLGMPLMKVVEAATSKPAAVIGKADKHGSLKLGVAGDATVLERQSGEFSYLDMNEESRTFDKRLAPVKTVLGGEIWQASGGSRSI